MACKGLIWERKLYSRNTITYLWEYLFFTVDRASFGFLCNIELSWIAISLKSSTAYPKNKQQTNIKMFLQIF